MGKPYVCPVCCGTGTRTQPDTQGPEGCAQHHECPACKGACVLWCPHEGAVNPGTFVDRPWFVGDPPPLSAAVTNDINVGATDAPIFNTHEFRPNPVETLTQ